MQPVYPVNVVVNCLWSYDELAPVEFEVDLVALKTMEDIFLFIEAMFDKVSRWARFSEHLQG
jgi:hypothetical protein